MVNRFHSLCRGFFSDNVYGGALIVFSTVAAATTNGVTHGVSLAIPPMQVLFFKCLAGLALLALIYRGRFFKLFETRVFSIHLAKGACGALGNLAWISAVRYLPLAEASALSLTSAFFTSLGGMWFFGEKFLPKAWVAIFVGFFGVAIIVRPGVGIFSVYAVLPLVSALFFSASSLFVKRLSETDESRTILLYLLATMAGFAFLSQARVAWVGVSRVDLAKFALIGSSYALTQVCLIEAYRYAHTGFLAPFKYARFPLNILTGMVFFAEIPPFATVIGGAIILMSHGWLIRLEYKNKRR